MPSNHLILCRPLLLLPSIFPSIRVFSNESAVCIRWPKYWSFSFNISPSNELPLQYSGLENYMNYTVHGVAKSWRRLSDFHLYLILMQESWVLSLGWEDTLEKRILQYSCLENSIDRGVWQAVVHEVAKSSRLTN